MPHAYITSNTYTQFVLYIRSSGSDRTVVRRHFCGLRVRIRFVSGLVGASSYFAAVPFRAITIWSLDGDAAARAPNTPCWADRDRPPHNPTRISNLLYSECEGENERNNGEITFINSHSRAHRCNSRRCSAHEHFNERIATYTTSKAV